MAGLVKSRSRREDDEVHDHIGKEHPDVHVPGGVLQLAVSCPSARPQQTLSALRDFVFYFLTSSEKQVRRDGRPKDSDERGKKCTVRAEGWNEGPFEHLNPVRFGQEGSPDVSKQR